MADATKRIANWDAGFDTTIIKSRLDTKRPDMLARMTAQTTAIVSMEGQVKQMLDSEGVPVIQYPFYLCFGRELWHLTHEREISGESASRRAGVLAQKWVGEGLSLSVLELIRSQVFNIPAPSGPGP